MIHPELIELSSLAREEGATYPKQRFVFAQIDRYLQERPFLGLVGPRGAGKTVVLKQLHARSASSFYVSLDTSKPADTLFGMARDLHDRGISLLLLDEVHYWPGFAEEIKKIFDFLRISVAFTSSSALSLHTASVDLSRRVRTVSVPSLSLREMVFFLRDVTVQPLTLDMLLDAERSRSYYGAVLQYEPLFDDLLQGRNFPFSLGVGDRLPLFRAILETVISKDLVMSGEITPEETVDVRRALSFVGKSPVEGINYSSISQNSAVTKYKAEKFVSALERAFIMRRVFPKGTNVTREPKVLLCPPYRLLFRSFDECLGALREDFFTEMMAQNGHELSYLKSMRGEKTPDYLLGTTVFEIGGRTKSAEQFKGVNYSNKVILTHPGAIDQIRRPLFFAGMF